MSNSKDESQDILTIAEEIKKAPKYKNIDICEDTLIDLIEQERLKYKKKSDIVAAVKKKLHNIIALYLGDPNYSQAIESLKRTQLSSPEIRKAALLSIMSTHVSTSERIPYLSEIYTHIFSITGIPNVIIDLACGLHPLSISWMNLPSTSDYYAFDIHTERVHFLNEYFLLENRKPLAEVRDILVRPPTQFADVVFLLKEAHRFEQRRQGCTKFLLNNLSARNIVISLPKMSMNSQHNLTDKFRRLIGNILPEKYKLLDEFVVGNEIFYFLKSI